VSYPAELPITACKDELVAALRSHSTVIVAGETGSGKSTQLPKICLEAGLGCRARIGCTQPRRVAALSLSRRVAAELGVEWGREVGCTIRFSDHVAPETSVKFMTDGILLAEVQGDPLLTEYEAIILDEAHERSLNIDFLLGHLKLLLQKRDGLKVIITSATIDTDRFAAAFGGAPVVEVSGRLYPVEVRYAPLDERAEQEGELTYVDAAVNAVDALLQEPTGGDLLVFMPGERDIRETCDRLRAAHGDRLDVVPLYGRLTSGEQDRVFAPGPRRRIVVATNIAETSLTVPRIRYVVDTGLARISRYSPGTRSRRLPVESISQSSADQRKGRCGRVSGGVCVRLYAEADYVARPRDTEPEIQRSDLAEVLLRLKASGLGEMETFPFLDPPSPAAVHNAYQLLQELGALDEQRALTRLGHDLARLPVDPAIGRMILQARREGASAAVLVIAAGLSIQDPRERPLDQRDAAEAAHRRFQHPQSDFLALLNLWEAYHGTWESLKTQSQLRKFCKTHFLSFVRMREWVDVHAQLQQAVEEMASWSAARPSGAQPANTPAMPAARATEATRPHRPSFDPRYAAIHRAILSGLLGHVAQRTERNLYRLGGNKPALVFPGSTMFEKPDRAAGKESVAEACPARPVWLVAGELLETSRLFLRVVAAIDPEWVIELAPHLVKVTHAHPRWEREAGRVLCTEKVTLRGLVLRERRISHVRVNPAEATACFIRAALIAEDVERPYRFLEQNRRLREKIEVWQTRMRHRVVPDLDEALFAFYAAHLEAIGSVSDLDRLVRTHRAPEFLRATAADLLGEHAEAFARSGLPDTVTVAGQAVPVTYAYAPGEERDGVTMRLSIPLAELADPKALEWAVPALREERVLQLLRLLPKELRRALMPLPAAAREITAHVESESGDYLAAMSEFVRSKYDVDIPLAAWPLAALPDHLRPRFEIVSGANSPLAASRDLNALRETIARHETPAEQAAWHQAALGHERYRLTAWDFGALPEQLEVTRVSGFPLRAFPGLHYEQGEVHLRLFRKAEESLAATRLAVPRLAERVLEREIAWLHKDLRALRAQAPLYVPLGSADELLESAWEHLRRHLFPAPEPPPRTPEAFHRYVQGARDKLPHLVNRLSERVALVLTRRQEAAVCRRPFPGMKAELEALVSPRFLLGIGFDRLAHLPRYLQALLVRAERAALNPAKDAERAQRVQPFAAALHELAPQVARSPQAGDAYERCRWLLEELKVSLFAQELGTAEPVSPPRLERALAELRRALAPTSGLRDTRQGAQ
jgi:ATP-dependent helicase HrpA